MKLETKRLILRDIEMKDAKDLIRNINNLKVSRYLLVVPYPYRMKDAKWWINHCKDEAKEKPRKNYNFHIELKEKKGIIGSVGIGKVDRYQGTTTLGYWLGEDYWRNRYMYEAASKVLDFAFNKLKLRRINVSAFPENEGSNSLLKKLGFSYEGRRIQKCRAKSTGKIHDENIYGLLKKDYRK